MHNFISLSYVTARPTFECSMCDKMLDLTNLASVQQKWFTNFMDVFLRYNQIQMSTEDQEMMTLMTN